MLKEALYKQCVAYVNKRLQNIEATISSHKKALESETKSSAGDKHETGRAMLQLEMEKAGKQFLDTQKLHEVLAKINIKSTSRTSRLGSLIFTEKANYFLAISCGELTALNKKFYAVSVSSPIGKLLLGKQEGDSVSFNGNSITITKVE